jgi:hypothetical protein
VRITCVYSNTGHSVVAAATAHATMNVARIGQVQDFGAREYPYHALRILAVIMAPERQSLPSCGDREHFPATQGRLGSPVLVAGW